MWTGGEIQFIHLSLSKWQKNLCENKNPLCEHNWGEQQPQPKQSVQGLTAWVIFCLLCWACREKRCGWLCWWGPGLSSLKAIFFPLPGSAGSITGWVWVLGVVSPVLSAEQAGEYLSFFFPLMKHCLDWWQLSSNLHSSLCMKDFPQVVKIFRAVLYNHVPPFNRFWSIFY